jgi:hypothetical protein
MTVPSNTVTAPPGVTVAPGRETVQQGPSGNTIQGMNFVLTLANGATTTVFVPYAVLSNIALVESMFQQRVDAINGVVGSGA